MNPPRDRRCLGMIAGIGTARTDARRSEYLDRHRFRREAGAVRRDPHRPRLPAGTHPEGGHPARQGEEPRTYDLARSLDRKRDSLGGEGMEVVVLVEDTQYDPRDIDAVGGEFGIVRLHREPRRMGVTPVALPCDFLAREKTNEFEGLVHGSPAKAEARHEAFEVDPGHPPSRRHEAEPREVSPPERLVTLRVKGTDQHPEHSLIPPGQAMALETIADEIADDDGRVGKVRVFVVRGQEGTDALAPAPQDYFIAISPYFDGGEEGRVALTPGEEGRDLEDDAFGGIDLARVDGGGILGDAEHVRNAVVADPVARAEFPVRIVIEGAPAYRPRYPRLPVGGVEDARVAAGLLRQPLFLVEALAREHVPVVFGDEVGDGAPLAGDIARSPQGGIFPQVSKVIEGVDVLEEFALGEIADSPRLARRIEASRDLVRAKCTRSPISKEKGV